MLRRATLLRAPTAGATGVDGCFGLYMHNLVSGLSYEGDGPVPTLGVKVRETRPEKLPR